MNRIFIIFVMLTGMLFVFPEIGFCEELADNVADLQHENEMLHSRSSVNFLASLMLMALIMMLFVWNIKKSNRRHMIQLQRKNNALQVEHDQALKAREEAEDASQMKTRFIQQMTHEIRTPLNAISGFSQLLTDPEAEYSKEEKQQLCDMVMQSTQHLTDMLDDIILLAESEGKSFRRNMMRSVSIKEFFASMDNVTHLSIFVKNSNGKETEVAGEEKFSTDVSHLKTAIQNVVSNAVKFGTESTVRVVLSSDALKVVVTDNGPGISKEDAKMLFRRFYKKDSFIPGVGLGLCVSRAILTSLGGNIMFDESYGEGGARFIIKCPVITSITD